MEITPDMRKRLQEVGRALSETDVPLRFSERSTAADPEKEPGVVISARTDWAGNEVQEWIAVSAQRDHVYAHLRYTSPMVWQHFIKWAAKQEQLFREDPHKGFPSAAFAVDIFNLIEDARVERAWVEEYPGTAGRIGYYNQKCADNLPFTEGIKAVTTALYYGVLPDAIPDNLLLTEEEIRLIKRALPLVKRGREAENTLEARYYAVKAMKVFRFYLADNMGDQEGYRKIFRDPVSAEKTPEEVSAGSRKEEKDESSHPATAEEEYQQLLAGAEKELKENKYRADRSKLVVKKQKEAEKLEKGIHNHIVPLDLEPEELNDYYNSDFENLTGVHSIKNKYRKQIMNLSGGIKEALLYKKILPERQQRKGWPDSGNLWKLALGETAVFRKKNIEAVRPDVCVMLLVDCSRSMRRSNRSEFCKQSLVVAAEALERNRVKFAVRGFTTGTQYNTVVNINFKDFDDTDIENLDYYAGFHENRDGYSIRRAVKSMEDRPEKKKILIVLSDSVPNHTHVDRAEINYSFELGKGIKDTILSIRETVRKGFIVVGIYFGDKAYVDKVRTVYPNFVYCEVLDLPGVLGSVLRRCLK